MHRAPISVPAVLFFISVAVTLAESFPGNLPEEFKGQVIGIADGDTIDVRYEGCEVTIRLDGIDCPEKNQPIGMRATNPITAI